MKQGCGEIQANSFRRLWLGCLLLIFLLATVSVQAKSTFTWDEAFAMIDAKYPNVPTIDVTTLKKWLSEDEHLLVIDVRKEKEFAVSRIPGAVFAKRFGKARELINDQGKRAVLYCSVGMRSAKLVEKLSEKGFDQVYNLKGSIFEWANQNNRMVNDQGETQFVHPFNDHWGQLLDADRHPPE